MELVQLAADEAPNQDPFVELDMESHSPWRKIKEGLTARGEKVESAVGVTPGSKAKVKADIETMRGKSACTSQPTRMQGGLHPCS